MGERVRRVPLRCHRLCRTATHVETAAFRGPVPLLDPAPAQ